MSWYDRHRCVYDFIRCGESGTPESFDMGRYDLSEQERAAIQRQDVAGLYLLGLHGVLLNRYCRQIGQSRDSYRATLQPYLTPQEGRGRWQN